MYKTIPIVLVLLIILSACSSHKVDLLPPLAGESVSSATLLWPQKEQPLNFLVQGQIVAKGLDLQIQGRVATKKDQQTLQVALLTQFGSSILQVEVDLAEYQVYSQSILLEKNPQLKKLLMAAVQRVFLPELSGECSLYGNNQVLQLSCDDSSTLYLLSKKNDLNTWTLNKKSSINGRFKVSYQDWQKAYPQVVSYEDSIGKVVFVLTQPLDSASL